MKLLDMAEADPETGDLIYETEATGPRGEADGTKTERVNVSRLLRPGARRTGDAQILKLEARWADAGDCPGNPAIPADQKTARHIMAWLADHDLEPAWKVCPAADYPPSGSASEDHATDDDHGGGGDTPETARSGEP